MCGILGFKSFNSSLNSVVQQSFDEALVHLSNRGPDSMTQTCIDGMRLGHTRLAIIDIVNGAQPMQTVDSRYSIVFNGEIFNYLGLRQRLISEGVEFLTHSDTEVVLRLFEKYSVECLTMLNGMFAFGIYDRDQKNVFLARDRMGVKPVFYHLSDDSFSFSSSIKSLLILAPGLRKEISVDSILDNLRYQASVGSSTVYSNVKRLDPGSYLQISLNGSSTESQIIRYWYPRRVESNNYSWSENEQKFRELFDDAVKIRLIADQPVGAYLSGGVDSAAVVASAVQYSENNLKTFTVGFDDDALDERDRATQIAEFFGTDHEEVTVQTGDDFPVFVESLLSWIGEPFSDPSLIPSAIVAREASKSLSVVLTGDGPDELWGGYSHHKQILDFSLVDKFVLRNLFLLARRIEVSVSRFRGKQRSFPSTRLDRVLLNGGVLTDFLKRIDDSSVNFLIGKGYECSELDLVTKGVVAPNPNWDLYTQFSFLEMQVYQQSVVIPKVDYATMYSGLEARNPFLDYRLVELCLQLNKKYKLSRTKGSKILLKSAFQSRLPAGYLNADKKHFTPPIGQWLRGPLRDWAFDILRSDTCKTFFCEKSISWLLSKHESGVDCSKMLWPVITTTHWMKEEKIFVNYRR